MPLALLSTPLGADGARCMEIPNSLNAGHLRANRKRHPRTFARNYGSILPHRLHPRVIAMHASEQMNVGCVCWAGNPQFLQEQARPIIELNDLNFLATFSPKASMMSLLAPLLRP